MASTSVCVSVESDHPTSGAALEKASEPPVAARAWELPLYLCIVLPTIFIDCHSQVLSAHKGAPSLEGCITSSGLHS